MKCEFISMEKADEANGKFVMTVCCKPSWLQRLIGRQEVQTTFCGHNTDWQDVGGAFVDHRMQRVLEELWRDHQPPAGGSRPKPASVKSNAVAQPPPIDVVQVASGGSFPASDPPCWTTGLER